MVMPYKDEAAGIMFAELSLAGQWFSPMNGGTDHEFTFSAERSLEASCADQAEIDRLREVLSSVPEAEQCGWVVDRFGVSWQIVPENMDELMKYPGAFARMLEMKKSSRPNCNAACQCPRGPVPSDIDPGPGLLRGLCKDRQIHVALTSATAH